jgi:hypothetical protein
LTDVPNRPRVLVIGNSPELATSIAESLTSVFDALGTDDPRRIRGFAAEGPVAAVLVTAGFPKPDPETLAAALRPALPGTCLIQVCGGISGLPEGTNYDGTLKFPLAPRVLAANVRRMIRSSAAPDADNRPLQAEIELRCLGLESQTYYEVLNVAADASVDDITTAYDSLSLRYHPDRLRKLEPESREHAMRLYIRIGDAYRSLRVVNDRMRYDHALKSGVDVDELRKSGGGPKALEDYSRVNGAKRYLKLAHKAISGKTPKLALPHLRFALTLDEGNPLIARKIEEIENGG